jgi:serine/threonine protein kinase
MSEINWKQNWIEVPTTKLESGGQGFAKIVKRKGGADDKHYFLKVLKEQQKMERRKRMHREVCAYETLAHPGIPRLIESNSDQFDNTAYDLYLVTDFVPGVTLAQHLNKNGPLQLNDAIAVTLKILSIVEHCHSEQCFHRDIKPDNIILKDASLRRVVK